MESLCTSDLSGKIIRFSNCYLVIGGHLVKDDLWVRDGVILDGLTVFFSEKAVADIYVDLNGSIISPGLIDLQVNGAYGYDFSNPNENTREICFEVAKRLPETGVTGFCPTIITSHQESYTKLISGFQDYEDKINCSKMLGIHLEGPFISKDCAGMHPTDLIKEFGSDPVKAISEVYGPNLNKVRIVTIAPELEGASLATAHLVSQGIVVSIGHTNSDDKSAESVLSSGATFVTHLFNAMSHFHHRKAHIFGQFASCKTPLHIGLIADLIHSHSGALCLAQSICPNHVTLVTDCNIAFGLQDGMYTFGVQRIQVEDKKAYVAGTDCLAGGTTSLLTCVRNFWLEVMYDKTDPEPSIPKEWTGLGYALAAASTRPARVLRLYSKGVATNTTTPKTLSISESHLGIGALAPGCSADFIIIRPITCTTSLKPELKLLCTWINGKPVYLTLEHETYIKMKSCI
nr:unnamed protein product [Trichobilharzia regenti]